jgi:hypothetical protein
MRNYYEKNCLKLRQNTIRIDPRETRLLDILYRLASTQAHTPSKLLVQNLKHLFHAGLPVILPATVSKPIIADDGEERRTHGKTPNRWSPYPNTFSSQSNRSENIGAASKTSVDVDSDTAFCRGDAFGQCIDGRWNTVKLSATVIADLKDH